MTNGTANHYQISGKGIDGVIDTTGPTGQPVVSVEVDGQTVNDAELAQTSLGLEVSATVCAVPDQQTVYLRVVLPVVNAPEEPVTFSAFAILATALTTIGGPQLVTGVQHLYELRPLAGTASVVQS